MTNRKRKLSVCVKCKRNITKLHYKIQCAGDCGEWFHKDCSGLSSEEFSAYELRKVQQKWACLKCSMIVARTMEEEDQMRPPAATSRRSGIGPFNSTSTRRNSVVHNLTEERDVLEDIFDRPNPTNMDIIKFMKKMYEELKNSITFNGSMMEQMKEHVQSIAKENNLLKKEQAVLKNRIGELEKEMSYIRGNSVNSSNERNKNIVIVGLTGGEKSKEDVKQTLNALKVNVSREDFNVRVLPSKNALKPILVSFNDFNLRDQVMECRKSTLLDTEVCGIAAETKRRIYINPDLPKHSRDLFLKAKELKSHGFKYVWCKNEDVLARKIDGDPVVRIITSAQIDSLKNDDR